MIRKAWGAHEKGDLQDAFHWWGHVTVAQLNDSQLLQAYGWLALDFGQEQKALTALNKALRLDANQVQTWLLLGNAFRRLKEWPDAEKSFRKILELDSENIDGIYNLAITLEDQQKYAEAEAVLEKGVALAPLDSDLHNALGSVLDTLGKPEAAIAMYRKAIQLDPEFVPLQFNLAQVLLQQGQWEEGWELYDSRLAFRDTDKFPETNAAIWKGEDLNGKTILVWSEQGFGDTIQFIRYIPLLKEQGAKVIFRTQVGLLRLLKQLDWWDQLVGDDQEVPATDFEIPLLSLPKHLGVDGVDPTQVVPYLRGGETFMPDLREPHDHIERQRVGWVWAGNPNHPDDHRRSMPGKYLSEGVRLKGFDHFSLQVGKAANQYKSNDLIECEEWLMDWSDTAAAIEELDIIIAVDTAVAHLAGAMGKRVWLLLDYAPDWRWAHIEWYPGMKIIRQQKPGDWEGLMNEVQGQLARLLR